MLLDFFYFLNPNLRHRDFNRECFSGFQARLVILLSCLATTNKYKGVIIIIKLTNDNYKHNNLWHMI